MKVNFYGTRGSIPVSHPEFQEFGGNTTCLLVTDSGGRFGIIDAGTGIRQVGKDIVAGRFEQFDNIHIGFTHFHWDHIQGFPFFEPAYDPRRHITLGAIGRGRGHLDLEAIFEQQMQAEYFPVPLKKMGAQFLFKQSEDDHHLTQGASIRVLPHRHPGTAYSYRIKDLKTGRSFVFATDVEHAGNIDPGFLEFIRGTDLLIHDGQYTPEELETKRGWGHSSWLEAIEVAEAAGVGRLCITHHDPDHDDLFLKDVEKQAQERFPGAFLAREGMELEV